MRATISLAVSLLGVPLLASVASAQWCGYIAPPRAPDFQNTKGFYLTTKFGMIYGPNHCVHPPFPPFQGMLPGPCCPPGALVPGGPGFGPPPCPPCKLYPGPLFAGVNHPGQCPPGGWGIPCYTMTGGTYGPWGTPRPGYPVCAYPGCSGYYSYAHPAAPPGVNLSELARNIAMTHSGGTYPAMPCGPCGPVQQPGMLAWAPVGPPMHAVGWLPVQGCPPNMGHGEGQGPNGIVAFPNHLYARGPRDFFMIDTDPRSSPYTYGLTGLSPYFRSRTPLLDAPTAPVENLPN